MPNGHDKNRIRLLGAIDGFRAKHDAWPTRVSIFPGSLRDIREDLFSPDLYAKLTDRVQLIANEAPFVAEDDHGNSYSLGPKVFRATGQVRAPVNGWGYTLTRVNSQLTLYAHLLDP
jgi:hypothetical protein